MTHLDKLLENKEGLLPCPWCDGKAEMRGNDAPENWVHCKANCQPTGRNKPLLIAAYNKRPREEKLIAIVRELKEALEYIINVEKDNPYDTNKLSTEMFYKAEEALSRAEAIAGEV